MTTSEPKSGTWRPTALSWPVLVPAIFYNIVVIVTLALLLRLQLRDGAVYFLGESGDGIVSTFLFGYLPILTAVVYSVYWGWIDLSAKRLEPWYQLSRPSGASIASSLALHYPTDFAPFVPWRAARKGHHVVMAASTVMVLIFWAVTPLQGALFKTTTARSTNIIVTNMVTGLTELKQQYRILGTSVLSNAYSYLWFGQALPPFTTNTYAVLPYVGEIKSLSRNDGRNITYDTILYETELDCWSPVSVNWSTPLNPAFNDGRGCIASPYYLSSPDQLETGYIANYRGYYDDGRSELGLRFCPQSAAHRFLGIWARADLAQVDFSNPKEGCALFCEPSYFKQKVRATVSASNKAMHTYIPISERSPLSDDEFNRTQFEYLLWNGVSPRASNDPSDNRGDYPDLHFIYQDDKLTNYSFVNTPSENMIGFAVGASQLSNEQYMVAENLAKSFEAVHKLLFAFAIQKLATPTQSVEVATAPAQALLEIYQGAVTISSPIAYILCATFGIMLLLTIYLLFTSFSRRCHLDQDPKSLRKICDYVTNGRIYHLADWAVTHNLRSNDEILASSTRFALSDKGYGTTCIEFVAQNDGLVAPQSESNPRRSSLSPQTSKQAAAAAAPDPFELNKFGRSAFIGCLTIITVTFCIIFILVKMKSGIFISFQSILLQQILLNYVPILAATLVEPFWVLLTRHACNLQPFWELASRPINARKSLELAYTSMPPQIIQVQAFRNGHYLLAALGTATLFANVLSLAMSSLFTIQEVTISSSIMSTMLNIPQLNGSDPFKLTTKVAPSTDFQHYYLVQSNVEFGTQLPPYLDSTNYYIPTNISNVNPSITEFQVNTIGIGASLDCTAINDTSSNPSMNMTFADTAANFTLEATFRPSKDKEYNCFVSELANTYVTLPNFFRIEGDPSGKQALEIWTDFRVPTDQFDTEHQTFCRSYMLAGWMRTSTTLSGPSDVNSTSPDNTVPATSFQMQSTLLACKPRIHIGSYALRLDPVGHVLESTLLSMMDDRETIQNNFSIVTAHILDQSLRRATYYGAYHNDTIASDWTNYLIKILANSTDIVDAQKTPPDAEHAKRYISDVFARTFAAQLYIKRDFLLSMGLGNSTSLETGLDEPEMISGAQEMQTKQKLFMSTSMFWLATAVLCYDLIVAIIFYHSIPKPFLRQVPNSILGVLALFEGSRAKLDFAPPRKELNLTHTPNEVYNENNAVTNSSVDSFVPVTTELLKSSANDSSGGFEEKERDVEKDEKLYAYGPFVGTDGQARIGIDIFPFATPIHMKQRKTRKADISQPLTNIDG